MVEASIRMSCAFVSFLRYVICTPFPFSYIRGMCSASFCVDIYSKNAGTVEIKYSDNHANTGNPPACLYPLGNVSGDILKKTSTTLTRRAPRPRRKSLHGGINPTKTIFAGLKDNMIRMKSGKTAESEAKLCCVFVIFLFSNTSGTRMPVLH